MIRLNTVYLTLALPCLALPCLANILKFKLTNLKNKYYIKSFPYDILILYLIMYLSLKLLNIKIFIRLVKYNFHYLNLIINQNKIFLNQRLNIKIKGVQ